MSEVAGLDKACKEGLIWASPAKIEIEKIIIVADTMPSIRRANTQVEILNIEINTIVPISDGVGDNAKSAAADATTQ